MHVLFTRIARWELEDAVRYYELEYSGLGRRFKGEVGKAAVRIAEYPQSWSMERGDKEVPPSQVSVQIDVLRGRRTYSCHRGSPPTPEPGLLGCSG